MVATVPAYDVDFYSDAFIRDPWPRYAEMRRLGPVVYLPLHDNYALTRHAEVSAALRDPETFVSGKGVAADPKANEITRGNSAASDGERHAAIRGATSAPLLPGALQAIRGDVDTAADALIERLAGLDGFDAIKDFATHLPLTIVRDMVGLPDAGRENMLRWANATFDLLGVQNERGRAAIEVFLEQRRFSQTQAGPETLKPGSWTHRLFRLAEEGALDPDLAPVAMRDYLNPSLDTTISATGQLIYQLGRNPGQWRLLREQPDLVRNAANEAVRMASPVRSFARHTSRDVEVSGHRLREGARVMMLFASANRDESVFADPDRFDITRNPRHHLGFGSGIHMCVGQHLAQLEMIALMEAMIPRISEIHVGEPTVALNNTIYSFAALPTRFVKVANAASKPKRAPVAEPAPKRTLRGIVARRDTIADDILSLELAPAAGEVFPDWEPGAHIDIHVRDGVVRQYSLTGPRGAAGRYVIAVQREAVSRGGSAGLHDRFAEGSPVTLSRPRNNFRLDESAPRYALFSGGIGLTPILAMASRLHALGRDFTWHVSARSRSRLAWAEDLDRLPFRDRVAIHLSQGMPAASRLDIAAEISRLPEDAHIYACGPTRFMDAVVAAAGAAGIPSGRVHLEHFGAEIDVNGDPFTVVAARSGKEFRVAAQETILAALRREDIHVETSCQNGVCGSCLTAVLDGTPDHRDMVLTAEEKAENSRMTVCCSRSRSAVLVLDI